MAWVALVAVGLGLWRVNLLVGCLGTFAVGVIVLAEKITRDHVHQRRASGRRVGPLQVGGTFLASAIFSAIILLVPAVALLLLGIVGFSMVQAGKFDVVPLVILGVIAGVGLVTLLVLKLVWNLS